MTDEPLVELGDLLAAGVDYLHASRVGTQLTDARRRLFVVIKDCVARDDQASLDALCRDSRAMHTMLKASAAELTRSPDLTGEPYRPRDGALVHAARALAALGLTLIAGPDRAGHHLEVFRRWIACSGLDVPADPITRLPSSVITRHAAAVQAMATAGQLDLLSLVWLIALDSNEDAQFPMPVRGGPSTQVLLDQGSQGRRATLRLSRIPGLPHGLVPEPSTMALTSGDERFRSALQTAWMQAGGSVRGAVVWSLTDATGPVTRVVHESLSLAFTVLLDEQRRLGKPIRGPLTVRRLRSRTAIVGRVDPARPAAASSVDSYDTKLAVAEGMRVIFPRSDEEKARKHNASSVLVPVATWRDAAKQGRKVDRRRVVAIVAAALLVVASVTIVLYWSSQSQRDADRRRTVAADLAARSVQLRRADPALAAKLGLAAFRIDPGNARAIDALRDVLADNRNVVRTWRADVSRVQALAVSQPLDRVVTSGSEQVTRVWTLSTGELKGEIPQQARQLVSADRQPVVAAKTNTGLALFDVGDGHLGELGELPDPSCTTTSTVAAFRFIHQDTTVVAVWKDGSINTYDVVTRKETACYPSQDTLSQLSFTTSLPLEKVVAADVVDPGYDNRADDEVVMALSDNNVISIRTGKRDARIEVPRDRITGDAALVAATPDMISVATQQGVAVWRRSDHSLLANPAGGFGIQPKVLNAANGHLLFAGDPGTAMIPLERPAFVLPDSLHQLNGGAATVAAVSEREIVAGGPDGRVSVIADSSGQLALTQHVMPTGVAFLPDGRLIAAETPTGTGGKSTSTWSTALVLVDPKAAPPKNDGTDPQPPRWRLTEAATRFYANDVAATASWVAAAGQVQGEGTVLVWSWNGRDLPRRLSLPESDKDKKKPEERIIAQVAFTPDGKLLVARHISGEVGVWSTDTWNLLGTFTLRPGTTAMEISSNHGIFLEGNSRERSLVDVDLATRAVVRRTQPGPADRITASADGSRLLTITEDGVVQSYNADLTPRGNPWRPIGSGAPGFAFAVDAAGRRLAIGQDDKVSIYDLDTQTLAMPPIDADNSLIVRLAWSPNGELLAGNTMPPVRGNKQVDALRVWRIGGLDWTSQVCRWAGGGLNPAEWSRYVGDAIPYINLCSEDTK